MDWSWAAMWTVVLVLSILAVARMLRRGRVESLSEIDLMPTGLREWMLGEAGWFGRQRKP